MAKEAAKDAPKAEAPKVTMLGLRKVANGFEVVRCSTADVQVVQTAEPLQFSARSLLRAIQALVDQA